MGLKSKDSGAFKLGIFLASAVMVVALLSVVLAAMITRSQPSKAGSAPEAPHSQVGRPPVGAPDLGDGSLSTPEPAPKAPDSTAVPQPGLAGASPLGPSPATVRQAFLDRQILFLKAGHLAYRQPSPIRLNDWRRVVVRVSGPSAPPDFVGGLPGSGPLRNRDVKVGSDLIADLSGPNFNVVRVGHDDGKRTLATGTFAE